MGHVNKNKDAGTGTRIFSLVVLLATITTLLTIVTALLFTDRNDLKSEFDSKLKARAERRKQRCSKRATVTECNDNSNYENNSADNSVPERKYTILKRYTKKPKYITVQRPLEQ